jgi:Tfp pilus assembly protein PilF
LIGLELGFSDNRLASVRAAMNNRDYPVAARIYQAFAERYGGTTADVYFSRRWARAAADVPDALSKLHYSRLANIAAGRATHDPEQRANAYYNLAAFAAIRNDPPGTETGLRAAIAVAPNWFKPHWTLARFLEETGRTQEARAEALRAIELDAGKHPEVTDTAHRIGATSELR